MFVESWADSRNGGRLLTTRHVPLPVVTGRPRQPQPAPVEQAQLLLDEAAEADRKEEILAGTARAARDMGDEMWVQATWETCRKLRVRAIIARARAFSDEPWIGRRDDDILGA